MQVLARLADEQDAFGFSAGEGFDINRVVVAVIVTAWTWWLTA